MYPPARIGLPAGAERLNALKSLLRRWTQVGFVGPVVYLDFGEGHLFQRLARLADQPLAAEVVYKPAKPGKLPGIVVDQEPRSGGLSAHDSVLVVVSKARHGLLPNFVGSSLEDVQREAARLKLRARGRRFQET